MKAHIFQGFHEIAGIMNLNAFFAMPESLYSALRAPWRLEARRSRNVSIITKNQANPGLFCILIGPAFYTIFKDIESLRPHIHHCNCLWKELLLSFFQYFFSSPQSFVFFTDFIDQLSVLFVFTSFSETFKSVCLRFCKIL